MSSNTDKINNILKKIDRERKLAEGASHLRKKTNNPAVIQKCNTQVREAQKNIEYLESILQKLQLSVKNETISKSSEGSQINSNSLDPKSSSNVDTTNEGKPYNQINRPLFTALDLLKYECPSLGHKIQYMMQLLEFKIQVETQYKEANDKMYNLYQVEGDRSSIAMAERGKIESDRKIQLMRRALKEYQSMYIDFDDISRENAMINTVRKNPLSGVLFIQIQAVRGVDHIQSPLFSRNPECIISIKIDDNEKARTRGSRDDRWIDFFDIKVEKANEVAVTIYDKINDQLTPVGLFWLSLSDISEEIRRQKVSQERITSANWMDASNISANTLKKVATGSAGALLDSVPDLSTGITDHTNNSSINGGPEPLNSASTLTSTSNTLSSPLRTTNWFDLEPSGEILITFGFVKTNESKTRTDHSNFTNGLGRHGAIRQRKEEVIESQGHRFVQKQFYNIMTCAVCSEFLRYTGYQCEDCLFLAHQKCIKNIIAKCISKSSSDISSDDTKLNHKIPHRFSPVTNRGAKWCCHCGYLLPFGKKNVRKCDECGIMCHANCVHYVPDLCGIPPKTIEKILEALRISQQKSNKKKQLLATSSSGKTLAASTQPRTSTNLRTKASPTKAEKPLPIINDNNQILLDSKIENLERKVDLQSELRKQMVTTPVEEVYPSSAVTRSSIEEVEEIPGREKREIEKNEANIEMNDDIRIPHYPEGLSDDKNLHDSMILPSSETIHPQHQTRHQSQHRYHHNHHHQKRRHRRRYGLDDFKFISVLGKGNFGKVMLAEYVSNRKLCAIKVLKKNFIIENDEVESTKSEKKVFIVANQHKHPFLLNLYQSFQTENRIYFVMEYVSGGDLMWHVQQKKFSYRRAQFYASEILLALKFLHDNGIIYRDLKLDNIMLTVEGHIKLADYGLCKENMWFGNTTKTFCGTPELMAPEIISGEQIYDKAVDWWAFGVLLYQMILTKTPFKGDDEEEVFNAILTDEPLYPISMTKEAVDIIQKLLTRDPKLRLGSSERDALEIMEHSYFENINFEDILSKKVDPPYKPEINDPRDARCFEEEFTSQAAKLTPINSVLLPENQEKFRGFTYSYEDEVL